MNYSKKDLEQADRKFRLNLVNSITGVKPANLIGTISNEGQKNVAIFSSIVHLGSNPAYIGFILRPTGDVPRHTHENILQNEVYTINSIPTNLVKNAHYTSGKFEREVSEFERCNIEPQFIDGFKAPFVKESPIKLGMLLQDQVPIPLNGTVMVIGSIEHILIPDNLVNDKGYIDLDKGNVAGISGLNTYYDLKKINQFPYVRTSDMDAVKFD